MSIRFIRTAHQVNSPTSQRMSLPVPFTFFNGLANFTVLVWTRPINDGLGPFHVIFSLRHTAAQPTKIGLHLELAPGTTRFSFIGTNLTGGAEQVSSTWSGAYSYGPLFCGLHLRAGTPSPTRFQVFHVVAGQVYDGTAAGKGQVQSTNITAGAMATTTTVNSYLAAQDDGAFGPGPRLHLNGDIEDFRIYNRVLSEAEKRRIFYTRGADRPERDPSLILRFRMQGVGTVVSEVATVGGIAGTPVNSPIYSQNMTLRKRRNRG